jgi:hypothetical protein
MPRLSALSNRSLTGIGIGVLDPVYQFDLYESTSMPDENDSKTFIIRTQFVPLSTTLYWTINHITTSPGDFVSDSGSITLLGDGSSQINLQLVSDQLTEGTEQFSVQLRTGSTSGPVVATSWIVDIEDTSLTVYTGGQLPTGYRLASFASPPSVSGVITDAEVFVASSITDQGTDQFAYYYSSDLTNWTQYSDAGFQGINYRADINTLAFYNSNTEDSEYGQLYLVIQSSGSPASLVVWNGSFFAPTDTSITIPSDPARIYIGYRNGPAFLLLTTGLDGMIKNNYGYSNWTRINSAGFNFTASNIQANIGWAYNTDIVVAANYNDPSGVRIVRSTDLGFSWDAVVDDTDWTGAGTEYVKGIAVGQGGYYALCANGADLVSTSTDGANWTTPAAVPGLRAGADNIWSVRTGTGFSTADRVIVTYSGANDTYVSILQFVFDTEVFPPQSTLTAFELGPFATPITEIISNGRQIFGSTPGGAIYVLDPTQAVIGPIPAEVEFTVVSSDWGGAVAVASAQALIFSGPLNATSAGIIQDLITFFATPVTTIDVFVNDTFVSTETIVTTNSSSSFIAIDTADGWTSPFNGSNQPNGTVIRFVQVA